MYNDPRMYDPAYQGGPAALGQFWQQPGQMLPGQPGWQHPLLEVCEAQQRLGVQRSYLRLHFAPHLEARPQNAGRSARRRQQVEPLLIQFLDLIPIFRNGPLIIQLSLSV